MHSLDHSREDWIVMFIAFCETHDIRPPHETLRQSAARIYGPKGKHAHSPAHGVQVLVAELEAGYFLPVRDTELVGGGEWRP